MTQQDDITQRLRDNADLDEAEHGNARVVQLEREAADEIERLRAELSQVRAPVADERAQDVDLPWLRAYMHHQIASDRWVVTADQARDFARAAVLADRQQRAGDADEGRLMAAAKGMTRLYSYVWDRTDGCLVVFPENVSAFDAAFDALRMATGEAVDDATQAEQGERDA
ncbi:hypothetical protein ACOTJL_19395 [Achromobacter xylosoxidans]